jgi:hypothetical protein
MRTMTPTIRTSIVPALLWAFDAAAQCTVNGKEIPCDQFWRDYGWIFWTGGTLFFVIMAFWIWMLVDCLKSTRQDKLVWVLVLLFGNIIGAVLYFFIARKARGTGPA